MTAGFVIIANRSGTTTRVIIPCVRTPGSGTRTSKGYWRVTANLSDEYGRTIKKSFERKTLTDAQNAARMYLAKHGRSLKQESGTLDDLFEQVSAAVWSKLGKDHQRSRELYRAQWSKAIGDMNVIDITTPILTRTIGAMTTGKSLSTISKARDTIRSALAYAVSDLGWITSNPANELRTPKASKTGKSYPLMTREEYERMLGLAPQRIRLAVRLVGECAMRPSEAVRVTPEHLISVRDHWLVTIPESKTQAGIRPVPISDELAREIEKGQDWTGINDPGDHIRKWWRKHSDTRFYDLRGWRLDEWRRKGVPAQIRSMLGGHTKEAFTQKVYETITSEDVLAMF
jgi:integrase